MTKRRRPFIATDSLIEELIEDARRDVIDTLEYNFTWCFEFCESPIEKLFAAALLHPGAAREFDSRVEVIRPMDGLVAHAVPPPIEGVYLYPQIKIGEYRVDFYIASVRHGEQRSIIVECDGHDFHEKTREQARRDKARDRFLVGQGYRLLRFTGSEIYADASECAHEALTTLFDLR